MKKRRLILFVLMLSAFLCSGQTHSKQPHTKNGNLFWPKSMPLQLTASVPGGEQFSLTPQQTGAVFFLDTEGPNFIRSKWLMDSTGHYMTPQQEILFKVIADSKPPSTTLIFKSSESYQHNGQTHYSKDLQLILSAKDALSGVQATYYSINRQRFQLYRTPIAVETGTDVHLQFYSVDNVGNVESVDSSAYSQDKSMLRFSIDNEPPKTNMVSSLVLGPKDALTFVSSDSMTGVNSTQYAVDSGSFVQYNTPVKSTILREGQHNVSYYSVDWINNKEVVQQKSIYVDLTPPIIELDESAIDGRYRTIDIRATDDQPGICLIEYQQAPNQSFVRFAQPLKINVTNEQLFIKATDAQGNVAFRKIIYSYK